MPRYFAAEARRLLRFLFIRFYSMPTGSGPMLLKWSNFQASGAADSYISSPKLLLRIILGFIYP
jgi:hypothetical protein